MFIWYLGGVSPKNKEPKNKKINKNKNRKPTSQAIADFPCKYLKTMAHHTSIPFLKGQQRGKYLFPQTPLKTLSADPLQSLQSQYCSQINLINCALAFLQSQLTLPPTVKPLASHCSRLPLPLSSLFTCSDPHIHSLSGSKPHIFSYLTRQVSFTLSLASSGDTFSSSEGRRWVVCGRRQTCVWFAARDRAPLAVVFIWDLRARRKHHKKRLRRLTWKTNDEDTGFRSQILKA